MKMRHEVLMKMLFICNLLQISNCWNVQRIIR